MFSSSPLVESFPSSRFPSPAPSPTRTETDDLPIEVDQSFNSSMSLSCSGGDASPSPCYFSPSMASGYGKVAPKSPSAGPSASASFLSPVPFKIGGSKPKRPDPVPIQVTSPNYRKQDEDLDLGMGTRPVGGRNFGRELSGNALSQRSIGPGTARAAMLKGKMLPPALPDNVRATTTMMSAKPRGGIPMKWSSSNEEPIVPRLTFQPAGLTRHNTEPSQSPSDPALSDSGMDIDSPGPSMSRRPSAVSATSASPSFSGAASFSGSPGLGSFFCDSPAPPAAVPTSKRRSLVAGSSPSSPSSPSAKRASYGSGRGLDSKVASSSALLFGANNARAANGLAGRRGAPYKRPPLATMPIATLSPGVNDKETGQRSTSAASAYPILYGGPKSSNGLLNGSGFPKPSRPTGLLGNQPMRRAYSVCDQQQMGQMGTPGGGETEGEDESEFENSPSMSIHAEYARRNGQKFVPRVDGSPNFKPVRSSFAVPTVNCKSPTSSKSKSTKESPYGPGGLPGFGDNEMDGKILPCHKVKEDGLVRITPETLEHLLDGRYSEKIKKFHILDCRFDYEYKGGHIDGAINVKSMDNLDELLLSSNKGLYAPDESGETGQCELPAPSRSGERKEGEQVVLIFHCEFSAKRAPTFAKHLRSRDRMLNNALYPKIYYPEVYILEGGYCGFYNSRPTRCEPQGYIPMDDPKHFERRNSDLHDFRKFARTRSFTYGETQPSMSLGGGRPPPGMCPPLAFAAASAAIGRRHGPTITEEDHDHDLDSSPAPGNCLTGSPGGNNDSPCPRVVSMGNAPVFGSAKPRQLTRVGFHRVASYAGSGFSKR